MTKLKIFKINALLIVFFGLATFNVLGQDLGHLRSFMQQGALPANQIPYGNNPKTGHYLNTGEAKIYYEIYGKGKPLVILHGGIVGSTYEMAQFIDSLSKSFQVIAISTRGHGKSEMGSERPSYERKAADVKAIIQAVTKDSVTILGFSDGAYTGYYFAKIYPEKIRKLIAIGAGEWKQGSREFAFTRKMLFSLDSLYFKQQLALMPESRKYDEWLLKTNQYYNSLTVGKEVLSAIQCPVLVMAGQLDQNAPLHTVIAAYEMIPHAQLSIIPNAPHPAFLVNFPAVWTSLIPFLKQ